MVPVFPVNRHDRGRWYDPVLERVSDQLTN